MHILNLYNTLYFIFLQEILPSSVWSAFNDIKSEGEFLDAEGLVSLAFSLMLSIKVLNC